MFNDMESVLHGITMKRVKSKLPFKPVFPKNVFVPPN